jgi:hypothetical protein
MRKILLLVIMILISASTAHAEVLTSPNYSLVNPKIVSSGGSADSFNYLLEDVEIGGLFGFSSSSAHYSLDTFVIDKETPPNPPTVNPVTSPTRFSPQILSGTKDRGTAIYVNGEEKVPLNNDATWSYNQALSEGENILFITARSQSGLESESISVIITLDTIPPLIIIDFPHECSVSTLTQIVVTGTIDAVPFSQAKDLNFGVNELAIESIDGAGNHSVETIEVYRLMEPIPPPQ